ncbi:monooxygenase family protein [Mycobacterium sp. PDNC021]|uniref:monooxygenase family protein n=1 Tax=Mycobacterium sp. PDNC021 TaxID=3391399 RepID=UPI003AAC6923
MPALTRRRRIGHVRSSRALTPRERAVVRPLSDRKGGLPPKWTSKQAAPPPITPTTSWCFVIGLRLIKLWRFREWWPVLTSAFAMTKGALALPNTPLLNSNTVWSQNDRRLLFFVQHWRSFDELMAWANNSDLQHKPAKMAFVKRTAYNGNVGVWHEAYKVQAGQFEAIYANMPRISLASAGIQRDLRGSSRGHDRVGDPAAH